MKEKPSSMRNAVKKDYQRNSECWYKEVCSHHCEEFCIRYEEMKYLVESSGIPKAKQFPDVLEAPEDDYNQYMRLADVKKDIVEFVRGAGNLYIASRNTGNGKTSWAIKLLLKYFDAVWPANGYKVRGMFVHVPTLLLQMKNFKNPVSEEYKRSLMECDLVVWDEIASSAITAYDYSNLLMFVENRLMNGRANIFTSNSDTKEQLEDIIGAKLASRIWNSSELIFFRGRDRRSR